MNTNVQVKIQVKNEHFTEVLPVGYKTTIEPTGTEGGYRFLGANGHFYDQSFVHNCLGYKPLSKIFTKLK